MKISKPLKVILVIACSFYGLSRYRDFKQGIREIHADISKLWSPR